MDGKRIYVFICMKLCEKPEMASCGRRKGKISTDFPLKKFSTGPNSVTILSKKVS